MIHELTQILWVTTPKGLALVKFLIDYGPEADLCWVCVQQETGEIWTWDNSDVRAVKNVTLGRLDDTSKSLDKGGQSKPTSEIPLHQYKSGG